MNLLKSFFKKSNPFVFVFEFTSLSVRECNRQNRITIVVQTDVLDQYQSNLILWEFLMKRICFYGFSMRGVAVDDKVICP
jgi:polysaccharide pyruvyl transferase WcaK-like protein